LLFAATFAGTFSLAGNYMVSVFLTIRQSLTGDSSMKFKYSISAGGGQIELVFEDHTGQEHLIRIDKGDAMKMMQLVPVALRDEIAKEKDADGAQRMYFIPVSGFQVGDRLDPDEVVLHVLGDTAIFYNLLLKRSQIEPLISALLEHQAAHDEQDSMTRQ
jgi:hypothetical protein